MGHGSYAVVVFLILSGYSLMIPIARSSGGKFSKGVGGYLKRRLRRILPPYYAALCFALLVILFVPGMNIKGPWEWGLALPALEPDILISHLLMIHNWNHAWVYGIDPPLWSIPVEFQLYFLLPFLMIPLWRKFGNLVMLLVAILIGLIGSYGFGDASPGYVPWFIGLFALGVFGASINFSDKSLDKKMLEKIPWHLVALGVFIIVLPLIAIQDKQGMIFNIYVGPLTDLLFGFSVVCFLISLTKTDLESKGESNNKILKFLKMGLLRKLGFFSYSLYMVHDPILGIVGLECRNLNIPITLTYLILLFVGIPLVLLLSYGFHLIFEKPFMSDFAKKSENYNIQIKPAP